MKFGVLIFPDCEELDFAGPWEMVTMWSKHAEGPADCWIIAERSAPVICAKGMSVNPHLVISECPQLDFILVPGGQGTRKEVDNPALIKFIADQAVNCKAVLSVCTGSFLLERAGLLNRRKATTHWASLDRLRALGTVEVVEERYVNDGKFWTSAGVSAGIDLTLAFIASVAGEETAGKVQLYSEYYPSSVVYGDSRNKTQVPDYVKRIE